MNYGWIFPYVDRTKVNLVFELGSRDALDAIALSKHFGCPVYAFECNPDSIAECRKNLSEAKYDGTEGNGGDVTLVEKAVHEFDGKVVFRPFDPKKYDNIGASSLYEIDFVTTRSRNDPDYGKKDVQTAVEVECTRLDTFIDSFPEELVPDLVCADLQEAELVAFRGLGDKIARVKYMAFEASVRSTYRGGCRLADVDAYLVGRGFKYVASNGYDYLYVNSALK